MNGHEALHVIVLAAGKGTRMKSDLAKVLHPVFFKPMIRQVLDVVSGLGPESTVVVTGHQAARVEKTLAGYPLTFVRQDDQRGTGHAVLCAADLVQEPFAVINADDFYGAESYRVLAEFLQGPPASAGRDLWAMVGFHLDRTLSAHGTVARGLCATDAEGFLVSVEELTAIEKLPTGARHRETNGAFRPLTGREIVSLNCWGFTPSLFGHLRRIFGEFLRCHGGDLKAEFFLPDAINQLIREGRGLVKVLPTPAAWFGVTYREDRPVVVENVRALIQAGAYPERLWA